jgi:GTP-binding protein
MFIDKAKIFVTAGRGGDGCISFRREKYVPLGGPDGGNGGKGGDVYLYADPQLTTLLDFSYQPKFKAGDGAKGDTNNKYGRSAEDTFIKVPVGTVVTNKGELVVDLKENNQQFLIAKGGRGGRGNSAFKTSRHTAPKISEKGEPGEIVELELELKLIADVGLVGFPNAGKSSLLARITAARPKIANYPFTTLSPNLGVAKVKGKSFVIADIPGLIEGAHEGRGLGDEFLRHVQRTKVLIHIVDLFGFDNKTAYKNYLAINKELEGYSKNLSKKSMIIAANKIDLPGYEKLLKEFKKRVTKKKIFPISAATGEGTDKLFDQVIELLSKHKDDEEEESTLVKKYTYEPEFKIEVIDDVFVISGKKIERLASITNFEQDESVMRFSNILKKMGITKVLLEKGIATGTCVRIGSFEFNWE